MTRKIRAKGRMDANNSWRVSQLLAADCKQRNGSTKIGGYEAAMVQLAAPS